MLALVLKAMFCTSTLLILVTLGWIERRVIISQPYFKIKYLNKDESAGCRNDLRIQDPPFKDILLVVNFNHPFYSNIPTLEEFYKPLFQSYVFCGPESDHSGKYNITKIYQPLQEYGFYGYQCLVKTIRRNPGWQGYFLINDDMIINWWNFLALNRSKIWFGDSHPDLSRAHVVGSIPDQWFSVFQRGDRCSRMYLAMERKMILKGTGMLEIYKRNTERKRICVNGLSDIFYIPGRLAHLYAMIGQEFYSRRMFLEIAVPMSIYSLDDKSNMIFLNGTYLQKKYGWGLEWKQKTEIAWKEYNFNLHFLHPYKFSGADQKNNTQEFKDKIGTLSAAILQDKCLDAVASSFSAADAIDKLLSQI